MFSSANIRLRPFIVPSLILKLMQTNNYEYKLGSVPPPTHYLKHNGPT